MGRALIGRCTDDAREEDEGVTGLLGAGGEEAAEDFLGVSAGRRAVAAEDLAVDHGGANGLLGGPVGGFDVRFIQERQDLVTVPGQVVLKLAVAVMRKMPFEQSIQPFFQPAAGYRQPMRADCSGVSPVT